MYSPIRSPIRSAIRSAFDRRIGGTSPALPSGAVGFWVASDFTTSPKPNIPNRLSSAAVSANVLSSGSSQFGVSITYTAAGVTANARAIGPTGKQTATVVSNSGVASDWVIYVVPSSFALPAGTYTIGVWVRWRGTGDANFRFGRGTYAARTATATWTRYSYQVTSAGTGALTVAIQRPASGNTIADFEIDNFGIYPGSVDLEADAAFDYSAGHMYFGRHTVDSPSGPTYSSGEIQFLGTQANRGVIQFGEALNECTVLYVGGHAGSPSNAASSALLSVAEASTGKLTINSADTGRLLMRFGNTIVSPLIGKGQGVENGNNVAVFAYDRASCDVYADAVQVAANSSVKASQSVYDFWVGSEFNSLASDYTLKALAIYPRKLTNAEVLEATNAIYAAAGLSRTAVRGVVYDGTSITYGFSDTNNNGYAYRAMSSVSGVSINLAVSGSTLANIVARKSDVLAAIDKMVARSLTPIVHVEAGANDLIRNDYVEATFLASLETYCDDLQSAGAKVVLATVLPRASEADSGARFDTRRATLNPLLRDFLGVHCDAIADFAADPDMGVNSNSGTSAGAFNTTYFNADRVHPNTTGHIRLATITAAAVIAV